MAIYNAPTFVNGQPPALSAAVLNLLVQAVQQDGIDIQTLQTQQANPYSYKGTVAAVSNLPSSGNTVNDTYYVTAEGCLYTWNGSAWSQSSVKETDYQAALTALAGNFAVVYSNAATYAVGDYCVYNNVLYRCTTRISTAESWNSAHWTQVTVGAFMKGVAPLLNVPVAVGGGGLSVLLNQTGTNTASGSLSLAQGFGTTASGLASHAEGDGTTASGNQSHAEGDRTVASGTDSHTEGSQTQASGLASHAEGYLSVASGGLSHAEGYGTVANSRAQHVFGTYNEEDPSFTSADSKGSFVEIVGNGTSGNDRSNARTLAWNGDEILAGGLTLGRGPIGAMDAATKEYVDGKSIPSPPTADGTYTLRAVVSGGRATLSWVSAT